jgi:cytoskeletal protein CcmA (bactofilin family)
MAWKSNGGIPAAKKAEYATFLDEGASIEGKFSFTGAVLLNGRLNGEIVSNDTLVVGEKGVVNASIHAGTVRIAGEVVGNVHATVRVELGGRARVFGNVDAPVVIIEEGAVFEGHCRMTKTLPDAGSAVPAHDASVVPLRRSEAT